MNRRDLLTCLAAVAAMPVLVAGATPNRQPLGLVIHSYWIRRAKPLPPEFGSVAEPRSLLEAAAQIGAAGIQTNVSGLDAPDREKLLAAAERHSMHIEGIVSLPKDNADVARFESDVASSKLAGAVVLRTVCMSGRRYEVFDSAEQFRRFVEQSWKSLTLAEPIAAKYRIKLAVENHKDWRIDEMLGWLKRLSSEFVGVCLDTGNSIALLEEPHAVVAAFAPWTITTHFKDMAIAESDDGFLLSEVPLGDGFLDLKPIVTTLRKAKPDVRLNLEMITRDPLRVPCLSPKYWATLGEVPARELAEAMTRIRRHKHPTALPTITSLPHAEQLRVEADNIARCLTFARENLS
jgi:sugar phosphate isomerase/epimerase